MATTINSGYANSPKLTANIADHADVYGGRALVFDGVTDYLNCGDIDTSGNFSFSCWFNADSVTGHHMIFSMSDQSTSDGMSCGFYSGKGGKIYATANHGSTSSTKITSVLSTGQWYHLVVTKSSGQTENIYINGASDTNSADSNWGLADETVIGSRNAGSNFLFNGKISDVKLFNSILTEAQVQELYKKPENTPSAVQDNLVAWYPMCEGNPESPQSIVYDHSEKKLGSDTFVGLNQWSPKVVNRESVSVSGDEITLTIPTANDAGMSTENLANLGLSTSLGYAVGDLVKLQFEGKITTNGSGFGETLRWYDTQEYVFSVTHISLTSKYQTFTFYGVISNLGYSIPYLLRMGSRTGTDIYKFKNFSVQKVLMGNHATTNFFGNMADLINESNDSEIWDATNNRFSFTTDGWSGYDDATSLVDDTDWVKTTNIDRAKRKSDADHAFLRKSSGTYEFISHPLTLENGKTYNVSGVYSSSSASSINVEVGASAPSSNSDYTHWATQSLTSSGGTIDLDFTAQGTTGHLVIELTGSANENAFLEHIAVREVGVSSSGFMPVTNEPVVPQVPLMRYNQKMLFSDANYVNCGALLGDNLSGGLTISLWFNATAMTTNNGLFSFDSGLESTSIFEGNKIAWYLNGAKWSESSTITLGKTYHVVFSLDTSSHANSGIYINGVKDSTGTATNFPASDVLDFATLPFLIGRYYSDAFSHDGLIDDVSMFSTAFNATQVQELFNDGVALDATTHSKKGNLLGYWRNDGVTTWKNRGDNFARFDGVNDLITRNAINVDYKSVSFWIKPTTTFTTASSNKQIMFFGNWTYGSITLGDATSSFNPNHELITMVDNQGSGAVYTAWIPTGGETIPDDSWTHIAFVWDGSKYVIYYNGQPQTVTSAGAGHVGLHTNKDIKIGTGGTSSNFFDGNMANVAFWSKSLTDAQVLSVYNSGHNGDISSIQSSDLELYYTFNPHASTDADTNASVQDRSGNNRDSTSVSGAVIDRDGDVQGSPDSITIREGLNSNRDGLGFYFTNPSSNVLRLNGIDEYLEIPKTNGINMSGGRPFSMSCWFKARAVGVNHVLISSGSASTSHTENSLYISSSNKLAWNNQHANADFSNSSGTTLAINTWYFGTVTFNGSTTVKIYLNDALDGTKSDCTNSAITHTDVYIGKRSNGLFFNGLIDEARIYNKELSLAEIQKNYKHQKGKHKND